MKLQASRSKRRDGAPIRAHVTARIVPAGASPHDREIAMSDDRSLRDRRGRFAPERQRRFDRAFGEIERLCRGRFRRRSDWLDAPFAEPSPNEAERIRWLLVAMARARGTAGGEVIARLALRGYPTFSFRPAAAGQIHAQLGRAWTGTETVRRLGICAEGPERQLPTSGTSVRPSRRQWGQWPPYRVRTASAAFCAGRWRRTS